MDHEEEGARPFYLSQPWVYGSCCLLSTTPPSKYKRKPGLIWSTNKVANTKCLSDRRAAAMLAAALLLTSNKSLMGDRDLLSSKWDTINAPVFLINDVGYEDRDKLTLLAAVRACVRAGGRASVRASKVARDEERETGLGYRQLLRVCTVCVEPWEASRIPPHHFHFITPGERTYIIQVFKPQSAGTDRAFNKHFNLNSHWSSVCYSICLSLHSSRVSTVSLWVSGHVVIWMTLVFVFQFRFISTLCLHFILWNLVKKIQIELLYK